MTDEDIQFNGCCLLILITMTLIVALSSLWLSSNSRDRISALEAAATAKESK